MKVYKLLLVLFITVFLSGCAVLDAIIPKSESPKTAKIFKSVAKKHIAENGNKYFVIEKYTVKKPFSYVTSRWKKRTRACLKRTYRSTTTRGSGSGFSKSVVDTKYTPKLKVYRKKASLSIQSERFGSTIGTNAINPPGGAYFMVVEAFRLKGKKTKIVVYRFNYPNKYEVASKAILNWSSGKSTACPDYAELQKPSFM